MKQLCLCLLLCGTLVAITGCASKHTPVLTAEHPAHYDADPGCAYTYPTVLSITDPVPRPTPMQLPEKDGKSGMEGMK